MSDRIMAFVAIVALAAFLGVLVWYVPRLDLGVVIAVTLVMVIYDFLRSDARQR